MMYEVRNKKHEARIEGHSRHVGVKCLVALICLLFASCGTFYGEGSTNSAGPEIIDTDAFRATFDASLGEESSIFFPIANNSQTSISITNISFSNNLCGSFSFINITDESNAVLLSASELLQLDVLPGKTIHVNIRFTPETCIHQDYVTTLYVYHTDSNDDFFRSAALLHSKGVAPNSGEEIVTCDDSGQDREFEETFLSQIPEPGEYYLRVDRMRGFIFPEGSPGNKVIIGTDINLPLEAFAPPFIKMTVNDNAGNFTLEKITPCNNFWIPSAETDQYFLGSSTLLTTAKPFEGTMTSVENDLDGDGVTDERIVHVNLNELTAKLRADGIDPVNSVIPNTFGTFQIIINTKLTTQETETNIHLGDSLHTDANFEEGIISLYQDGSDFGLAGSPFVDGRMLLVGIGGFRDDDQFIGNRDTSGKFLVEDPSFMFVQLEATMTQEVTP